MPALYANTSISSGNDFTGGPVRIDLDDLAAVSFHQRWNDTGTADLVATTTVEATNDPRVHDDIANGTSTAKWQDVSSLLTITSPTSGAGGQIINFSGAGWTWVRLKCAHSSGTDGGYVVWLNFSRS